MRESFVKMKYVFKFEFNPEYIVFWKNFKKFSTLNPESYFRLKVSSGYKIDV